jgi:ABC-type polysaccharide/polyol phosphate transport system ATPase subunit
MPGQQHGTLRFEHVRKSFPHKRGQALLRDRLLDFVDPSRRPKFEALRDVSFSLQPGESLALIGANGAGKSTVLNMATGLLEPDSGRIEVYGKVGALLELGAGFHQYLTGAENVRIHAALMGLSRKQTAERFDDIVEFSGVREFLNDPIRTYSQGMQLRLAFAVAISADPDILIMDELIGVGDQDFQRKSMEKIRTLRDAGKTLLFASHSAELVTALCDRALWLNRGQVVLEGPVREVLGAYQEGKGLGGEALPGKG